MPEDKIMERVRALLAKAASTEFPEEAEAFIAKAEALMARHSIDRAMLTDTDPADNPVTSQEFTLADPYGRPKHALLHVVAENFHCVAIGQQRKRGQRDLVVRVFGRRSDLELVEVLFTSLLAHATRSMLAAVPVGNTRSFRQSFILSYVDRIGERLAESSKAAEAEYEAETGVSALPVLRSAFLDAQQAMRESLPPGHRLKTSSTRASTRDGEEAGKKAADQADLGQQRVRSGLAGALGTGA